jgi:hypothetical protein
MSIRSGSIGNLSQRASSARTAPGGSRSKIDRAGGHAESATLLPSLGGSALGPRMSSKPPGLPLAASSMGLGGRTGNRNAKENKNTTVITIDDLQRLRETCGIGGAKSQLQIEQEIS